MKLKPSQLTTILAIIRVFETSRPLGSYAACVVLNDGAGISYGISQFTHRSGSLAEVVREYLRRGGRVGREVLADALPRLDTTTPHSIAVLSANDDLRSALVSGAATAEMREAQDAVAAQKYLGPAMRIWTEKGFEKALSLAVIYDSITHGSFEKIASGIITRDERSWTLSYIKRRDKWLASIPRLNSTRYRTKFFLDQIAVGNWDLRRPLKVHGVRLTDEMFAAEAAENSPATEHSAIDLTHAAQTAISAFDRADAVVQGFSRRSDSVRSLWTAVGTTIWQAAWGIFGSIAGVPIYVWIVVAVITGIILGLYLYRQIILGRIRETASTHN